jgi:hypothetical protein
MPTRKPQTQPMEGFGQVTCRRCDRVLTDPVSRVRGIGPVCRAKVAATQREGNNGGTDPWDNETMDVTMRRRKGLGITNIEHTYKHHSPTGMEWGYHGSGAADLALNILARFLPLARAGKMGTKANRVTLWDKSEVSGRVYDLHQGFKRDFIASMPYHGGTIEGVAIRDWLIDHGCPASEIAGSTQPGML